MRRLLAALAAGAVLLLGAASAPAPSALPRPREAAAPGVRERTTVRVNGVPMTLERRWSPEPPPLPGDAVVLPVEGGLAAATAGGDACLAHPSGDGWTVWSGRTERFPIGNAGRDPGGVRPPRARRLLSLESDRDDALAAGLYDRASDAGALEAALEAEGWAPFGGGLWTRGPERLLADDGRSGTALVYWRLPAESP